MSYKKILIADDHSAIRKGIKHILASEFNNVVFGEATTSNEVVNQVASERWDLIILDIDMPGRNGLDLMKQFKSDQIETPILVFSMHREELIAIRALKLGAYGYVSKDSADTELITAINHVFLGKKYISPKVAELMVSHLEKQTIETPHEILSDREFQTFVLIAKGKSVSMIAEELSLSIPTISTYRARIIEKTGLKNNAEIAAYSIRHHLI